MAARRSGIFDRAHPRGSRLDSSLPRRRHPDSHTGFVHLGVGSEHAAGGESARPRRDIDDPLLAVREGSGGRTPLAPRRPFLCPGANRYRMGRFGRFAVLPSLMSSMKIDGARLTDICNDGKPGVCCSRFGGREEFTPRVPVYLDRMSRRYRSMLSMTNPVGATVCSQEM